MDLKEYIRDIEDFPKEGITFKDITPLLGNASAFAKAATALLELVPDVQIDKVVGIEARGFFFGTLLAEKLGAGFVPVRKPKKLPHTTIAQTYELEYGTDTLEMHVDAISKGDKVLLHDDVLATGGTAAAVIQLIEKAGGAIVQCNFLGEIAFLEGRKKLEGQEVKALFQF
ncbi:adenine phosphoribosyltransferase [Dokdonia sinensis]|uniref:adenine phosphoribosyltransferase n=1 Tax=Dokdonia sinensis TaxID=2479847 RepID=UPI00191C021A|nr:adenine phosphoribosyltransferase [Dokdonia sinensis]